MLRYNSSSKYELGNNISFVISSYNSSIILPSIFIFLFCFWYNAKSKHFKIINNYIHLIHAVFVLIGYNYNIFNIIVNISTGFLIADAFKLIFIDSPIKKLPFILHHIIAISVLYLINQKFKNLHNFGMNVFYALEFSNISLYINYLIIKSSNNRYLLLVVTLVQLLWYSYFRLFIFTKEIINFQEAILNANAISIYIFISIIFLMGLYWSGSLCVKVNNLLYKIYKTD